MSNTLAFKCFEYARKHYEIRSFDIARHSIRRYKQFIEYRNLEKTDRRKNNQPEISIVIVCYNTGEPLLDCITSVYAQHGRRGEVILVDHGGNEAIHHKLSEWPLLHVMPPVNLLPSEGRNIGANFARSDLLVFLDDDAIMEPGYIVHACKAMADQKLIGLRGRIVGKSDGQPNRSPHYCYGNMPKEARFNLEGNMVIRRQDFQKVGGFDPLMFGHEGNDLTRRLIKQFPNKIINYWPKLVIQHDYAINYALQKKNARKALADDYMDYIKNHPLSTGVSILVRAGEDLPAAIDFLDSFVERNTYKPVEILLWAKDSQIALASCRPYIAKIFVRVLASSTNTLGRIGQQARYDNLLIVDLPTQITGDVLPNWVEEQQTNQNTALLCAKQQIATLTDTALATELTILAKKLGKSLPKHSPQTVAPTIEPPAPEKSKTRLSAAPNKSWIRPVPKPDLTQKINQTEAQIHQIGVQIAQTDTEIAKLESQYLPLPEKTPEKQALNDQLEDKVLASCRLLIDLKDAQDNLQELRIRKICGA